MIRFSANLGFLWTELSLPDAIRAAAAAGFTAVECHFPYDQASADVTAALQQTGLPMLGLNTVRGDTDNGEFGLCALPGRESDARQAIDQAIDYAQAIGCQNVHVMAGRTTASAARDTFLANLSYAAERAQQIGITILIEPINQRDAPDYHLSTVEDAASIIETLAVDNVKIMFDCYHIQIMQGDLLARVQAHLAQIGHIQIAAAPSRNEPDSGEINYPWLLTAIDELGYQGYIGAEYKPAVAGQYDLSWMTAY